MYTLETPRLKEAKRVLAERQALRGVIVRTAEERLISEWAARGGCHKCRGRGWVVTWDTLDCMDGSCADFGPCPKADCTPESRAFTGYKPGQNKYDKFHSFDKIVDVLDNLTEVEADAIASMGSEISKAAQELRDATEAASVSKGTRLKVVKGRKVARGTEGEVFWCGPDRYRGKPRVGIRDDEGKAHWTALDNCTFATVGRRAAIEHTRNKRN